MTTLIVTLEKKLGIPVFDDDASDNSQFPQIVVAAGIDVEANQAKNEQRTQYSFQIDYYDRMDGDHGAMMDNEYIIKDLVQHIKLKNYNCVCQSAPSGKETTDNSTSIYLRRWILSVDYYILEKQIT